MSASKALAFKDPSRDRLVAQVTRCFSQMGASEEQLLLERDKLSRDDIYLESWLKTIQWPAKKPLPARLLSFVSNWWRAGIVP